MDRGTPFKMLHELVLKNRSFRRFHQHESITQSQLRDLVSLARLSASGGNRQSLKYILSWQPEKNARIFPAVQWAAYLKGWPGPAEGERPSAYIVLLCDKEIAVNPGCDHGIAAQSMLLGAAAMGLGGCMIGSVDRPQLRDTLAIPDRYDIALVLAIGKPRETVLIDTVQDGKIEYWRDERSFHHVPKRALSELILDL